MTSALVIFVLLTQLLLITVHVKYIDQQIGETICLLMFGLTVFVDCVHVCLALSRAYRHYVTHMHCSLCLIYETCHPARVTSKTVERWL